MNIIKEFIKYHVPNWTEVNDHSVEFCFGYSCTDCKVVEACNEEDDSLIPRITRDEYLIFKEEHPEYFI